METLQLSIDWLHVRENTPDNTANLRLQGEKFNRQCQQVLDLLRSGVRLTCATALLEHHIGHLPRRVADLRGHGIDIKSEWIETGGSRYKSYFL